MEMFTMDQSEFLLKMHEAYLTFSCAVVKALDAKGITNVDEFTKFMEATNITADGTSNEILEGMVDAMRQHMMASPNDKAQG